MLTLSCSAILSLNHDNIVPHFYFTFLMPSSVKIEGTRREARASRRGFQGPAL